MYMKYVFGLAFAGAFLQGNFELAIIIAILASIVIGLLYFFSKIQQRINFSKFSEKATKNLGSDCVLVRLQGVDYPDLAGLIYHVNHDDVHMISAIGYGSNKYKINSIGKSVFIVINRVPFGKDVTDNCIIKIEGDNFYGSYRIQDSENWSLLKRRFKSI